MHASACTGPAQPPPRLDVAALLGAAREAVLVWQQQEYRLRITQQGKLILTK